MQRRDSHIAALLERLGRLLATEAHADGLLPVHWEALRYIDRANRFSRTAGALVAYLGITKGTVSQTVKALESKGLVKKRADATDRRRVRLALTAKGRRVLNADPLKLTEDAVASLNESDNSGLAEGLEALLSTRLLAQQRRPFGLCRDCRYFARRHKEGRPSYCQLLAEPLSNEDALAICHEQQPLSVG